MNYNKRRRIKREIAEVKEILKTYNEGFLKLVLETRLLTLEDELKKTYKNYCMS